MSALGPREVWGEPYSAVDQGLHVKADRLGQHLPRWHARFLNALSSSPMVPSPRRWRGEPPRMQRSAGETRSPVDYPALRWAWNLPLARSGRRSVHEPAVLDSWHL